MTMFYQCPNCGFISLDPKTCPACQDNKQYQLGWFNSIEEAIKFALERQGGFYK
jgi:hypothetical protein